MNYKTKSVAQTVFRLALLPVATPDGDHHKPAASGLAEPGLTQNTDAGVAVRQQLLLGLKQHLEEDPADQ